jgi:hypothetical protein
MAFFHGTLVPSPEEARILLVEGACLLEVPWLFSMVPWCLRLMRLGFC